MAEFKEGQVVRLKSGSPKMTVAKVGETMSGGHMIKCQWFDEENKIQSGIFAPEMLEPSE